MDSYFGRTVLVTGASSGIGEAMARQLALRKARLVLTARSEDKLRALAGEFRRLGADAAVYAHDLGQPGAAAALWDRLDEDHRPDVLINNAGFGEVGRFVTNAPDEVEGMITLNATALAVLTRLALPEMLRRGFGGVLNVASTAAFVPAPYFAVYAATKAFVLSFSEALHAECDGTGVAVSCLCPGATRTGFGERADMDASNRPSAWPRPGSTGSFFRKWRRPRASLRRESAERVAETGLDGLLRGDRVVVSRARPTRSWRRPRASLRRRSSARSPWRAASCAQRQRLLHLPPRPQPCSVVLPRGRPCAARPRWSASSPTAPSSSASTTPSSAPAGCEWLQSGLRWLSLCPPGCWLQASGARQGRPAKKLTDHAPHVAGRADC